MKQTFALVCALISVVSAQAPLLSGITTLKKCKQVVTDANYIKSHFECVPAADGSTGNCWSTYWKYTMKFDPLMSSQECYISYEDYGNFIFEAFTTSCASPAADFTYKYANYSANHDADNTDYTYNPTTGALLTASCGSTLAAEASLAIGKTFDLTSACDGYVKVTQWTNATASNCIEWVVYGDMYDRATVIAGGILMAAVSIGATLVFTM